VVLITGAGGGLGRALVEHFAAHDWRVVAGWHQTPACPEIDAIWHVQLDVTHPAQAAEVVEAAMARWGRIDLLINNAGLTADQLFWQISDEDWQQVIDVNLRGAFICSRAAARPMLKQRDGQIVNISSFSARNGTVGQAGYAAAKAGLIGLTQSLARELGSRNIRVNAILPGVLPTAMTASLPGQRLAELAAANALGRINSLDEVARFIAFLATMENVSGQIFQLDSRIGSWT
jgi:3-oxoacyl-[acyl-carrier protein] reductase